MGNRYSKQADWQECRNYYLTMEARTERDRDETELMLAFIGKLMARRDLTAIEPSVDGGVLRLFLPHGDETIVVMPKGMRFIFVSPDAANDPHIECKVADLDAMVALVCDYARAGFSAHRAWEALRRRYTSTSEEPGSVPTKAVGTAPAQTLPHQMAAIKILSRDPRVNRLYPSATSTSLKLRRAPRGPRRPAITVIWREAGRYFVVAEPGGDNPAIHHAEASRTTLAETVWRMWESLG